MASRVLLLMALLFVWLPPAAQARDRLIFCRTRVAEALGVSRLGLRQKMRRLGLDGDR